MYKCKYFNLKEILPSELHGIDEYRGWLIFDDRVLRFADYVRENYGSVFVNAYGLNSCGFRPFDSEVGSKYSQHKFGRALDLHIQAIESQNLDKEEKTSAYNKVRDEIRAKAEEFGIFFEEGITWLHIDCGNRSGSFNA